MSVPPDSAAQPAGPAAPGAAGPEPPPDAALVRAVAAGDEAAFAALVARHADFLLGAFRRLGLDAHAAEDCAQDTFLRLLRASDRYEPRAPFRGFLLALARNALVDWKRRRKEAGLTLADPHDPALLGRAGDIAPPSGDRLDLAAALTTLPEKQRRVVELSVFEGNSHAEVAGRLGIPTGTVKSRLHHALARLRLALGGGGAP